MLIINYKSLFISNFLILITFIYSLLSLLIPHQSKAQTKIDPLSRCFNDLMYRPSFPDAPELGSTRTDVPIEIVEKLCQNVKTIAEAETIVSCMNNLLYSGKIPIVGTFDYSRTEISPEDAAVSCGLASNNSGDNLTLDINKIPPELINEYLTQADIKYQNRNYQEALIDYSIIIEIDENNVRAFNSRAAVKYQLKDYRGAFEDYSEAIKINANSIYAYYGRGYLLQIIEEYERAIADYTKVIELDDQFVLAYRNRGLSYDKLGDKRKAKSDFKKAARILKKQDNIEAYEEIQQLIDNLEEE